MKNNEEIFATITEQGNYGLGIGKVTEEKERQEVQRRLDEMKKQTEKKNVK